MVESVCICAYKDYKEYTENANRMLSVGNEIIYSFSFLLSLPYFLCAFLKIIKHYFKKGRKEVVFINGCFHTDNAGLRLGCMYVAGQGSMARQQPGIFKELLATDSFLQPQHGIGGG